jgi:hypothetical protein
MRNGRFHLTKCRSKLQKIEVHIPKMPSPSPNN